MKRYAIGRKIELLAKIAHPAVGKFATAQESDKGQVKRGPDHRKIPGTKPHEEPYKVPLLITLSDGCYAQFPVIILPPISCRLAGVRLAVIDRDFHRGDETILNFATVW